MTGRLKKSNLVVLCSSATGYAPSVSRPHQVDGLEIDTAARVWTYQGREYKIGEGRIPQSGVQEHNTPLGVYHSNSILELSYMLSHAARLGPQPRDV